MSKPYTLAVHCLREAAATEGRKSKTWSAWALRAMRRARELDALLKARKAGAGAPAGDSPPRDTG